MTHLTDSLKQDCCIIYPSTPAPHWPRLSKAALIPVKTNSNYWKLFSRTSLLSCIPRLQFQVRFTRAPLETGCFHSIAICCCFSGISRPLRDGGHFVTSLECTGTCPESYLFAQISPFAKSSSWPKGLPTATCQLVLGCWGCIVSEARLHRHQSRFRCFAYK